MLQKIFWEKIVGSAAIALQFFQLGRFAAMLGLSLFAARFFTDKNEVAVFELFLWLSTMFTSFWVSGFFNTMIAAFSKNEQKRTIIYQSFWGLLLTGLIVGVGFLLISWMYPSVLQSIFSSDTMRWAVFVYIVGNGVTYLTEYSFFLFDKKKQLLLFSVVNFLGLLLLPISIAIIYNEVAGLVYGLLLWTVVRFIIVIIIIQPKYIKIEWNAVNGLIRASFPLMLMFLIAGSADTIDGMVIKEFFDNATFTVYRYGSKEFPLFLIVASTLSTVFIAKVATDEKAGLDYIKHTTKKYSYLFFPFAILLLFFSGQLYTIVFGKQYLESVIVFDTLLLLLIPRLLFPQSILVALGANKLQLVVSVIEMCVNLLLSVVLAIYYGVVGVAFATVIAFMVEKIILSGILYVKFGISLEKYTPLVPYLLGSAALFLLFLAKYYIDFQ